MKEFFGAVAAILSVVCFVPYLRDIFLQKTRPHAFSWFIWFLVTAITYGGQICGQAGAGAWGALVGTFGCLIIFLLSLKYGEKNITQSDRLSIAAAFIAIALWIFIKTPLYSILIATLIDLFAFFPTFRKSYLKPYEETMGMYIIGVFAWSAVLAATEHYSLITALIPTYSVIAQAIMVLMLSLRRRQIPI